MELIRKTALVAAATFFTATLFGVVILTGLQRTLGSTTQIKQALRDSGIYKSVISDALAKAEKDQNKQAPTGQTDADIPLQDPRIKAIVNQSFSPTYIQAETEKVLDNAGAWLHGDTKELSFAIDIQEAKIRLADGLSAYVKERAASLPACTAANIPQQGSGDFDVFNAECLPPGTSPDAAAAEARNQILQGELLKDTQVSASSIKNDKGETLNQQLRDVPAAYQNIEKAVYLLGVFAALFGASVIFLSVPKRAGLKRVAITAIIVGTATSLMGWISSLALDKAATKLDTTEPLQQSMFTVVQNLTHGIRMWWIQCGITLIVAGIAVLVTLRVKKSGQGQGEAQSAAPKDNTRPNLPVQPPAVEQQNLDAKPSKKPVNKKLVQ